MKRGKKTAQQAKNRKAQRTKLSMDAGQVKAALEALEEGDEAAALDLLKGMIADAASGGSGAPAPDESAEMADDDMDEDEELADDMDEDDEEELADEDKEEAMAAATRLARLTGKRTMGASIAEVKVWRKSHLTLEKNRAKIAKERAALDGRERRDLTEQLIKLNNEVPGTAWADPLADEKVPAAHLMAEPLDSLRARVAKLSEARGVKAPAGPFGVPPVPPRGAETAPEEGVAKTFIVRGRTVELSARELEACADAGAKPEIYAANKLARQASRGV